MNRLERPSKPSIQPLICCICVSISLSALASCSFKEPKQVPEPAAKPVAASPFPRLADPGGCIIEQITSANHEEYQVQGASRDGKLLAMTARMTGATEEDTTEQLFEVDLESGERTKLPKFLTNSGAYSPDARFNVLAQETDNGRTDIFEYERATAKLTAVAPHEQWDWLPSYSPDGRFIVFNSYRVDGQADIHLFEKSTGALQRLTTFSGYDAHAQFSPDGKRILFHRQQGKRENGGYIFDLIVYEIESGEETQLTDGQYEESYASWAPDGRHIVYSSDIDGKPSKHNLYVLAPSGKTTARLSVGDWKDSYAFWSHDGKFIYFNSDRAGPTNIYRVVMDGFDCLREDG
ncbi:MAG: hypothetical protein HKN85_01485 [Gammaproteobacteria bacterium]|nr:hypothetical protein [Gammaproteobacteria bacterium]